jgi:hypothetical protein
MDVGAWLRGLGLGQYEGTFRESEIEADVLPELTRPISKPCSIQMDPHSPKVTGGHANKAAPSVIGTKRTCRRGRHMSVVWGRTENMCPASISEFDPKQTSQFAGTWSSRPSSRSQVNDQSCESAVVLLARDPHE